MTRKSGVKRTRFSIESIKDLRNNLQSRLGSGLLVSMEKPEDFIPELIRPNVPTTIVLNTETCCEEREIENDLRNAMQAKGTTAPFRFIDLWDSSLIHIDDLPGSILQNFPPSGTQFLKQTE